MRPFNIYNLPPRLFKYYSYDTKLNPKRLSGEVYLACPYDFNDPCDCQREIINNTQECVGRKGKEWLQRKMKGLGFKDKECKELTDSLLLGDNDVKLVHRKMLEKLGILCLTRTQSDILMWGYYANNEGLCIEYDVTKIVRNLIIGYINKMSYTSTKYLYDDEKYFRIPEQRTPTLKHEEFTYAKEIIRMIDIKKISNSFLDERNNELNVLNFARNILLKRIYAQSIIYNISPDGSPSPLFFNREDKTSETKYFKKTKPWKHEDEFRFIISLGGRLVINLGKDCIKNIYLGCNMSNERVVAITYLMAKNNLTAGLYKMRRLKNCGLAPQSIAWVNYRNHMEQFEEDLNVRFPES